MYILQVHNLPRADILLNEKFDDDSQAFANDLHNLGLLILLKGCTLWGGVPALPFQSDLAGDLFFKLYQANLPTHPIPTSYYTSAC